MTARIAVFFLACFSVFHLSFPARAFDINVSEFRLENGLTIVFIPDRRAPVITHMIWYRVGAADEPQGKAGIAHFLEHLMFKGTEKYPGGAFSHLVRINGGVENAFTTQDYTVYHQRIAKERLELVMEIEADRMQNLVLTDENVLPELLVVQEERRERTDNNPSALLVEQMYAAMYTAHPYGKPIIGWMPEVSKLTRQDAMNFYTTYYQPANAVVLVTGDATFDEVKALAAKHYGDLKNSRPPQPRLRTEEPPPIAERRVILNDARAATPYWQRNYIAPAEAKAHGRQALALELLANVLGSGTSSRFYRKLVVQQKVASGAGAWYSGDDLDYGTFGLYAAPNEGVEPQKLESAIETILADVVANGVTQAELDATRNSVVAETVYLLDNQEVLARVVGAALLTGQTLEDVRNWDKNLASVTVKDVVEAAKAVLEKKNSVTGLLLPAGEGRKGAEIEPAGLNGVQN